MAKEEQNGCQFKSMNDVIDNEILNSRRIFISDGIDSDIAHEVIRKLWYLELKAPGKPILLVINSPGGSVDSGFAIWDQIKMITSPVYTLVSGLAASMGSVLSLCAPKGKRFATKNARIMIHQPSLGGVVQGQATDLIIQAEQILKTRNQLVAVYHEATGKEAKQIEKDMDRDCWMNAKEAMEYGLIDKLVTSFNDIM
jgi:ATP-dependent Clp protease protease subunit